jgi:hypothetical protein
VKNIYLPLPDEPKGWLQLQRLALSERDPKKLDVILRCMNQVLTMHEYEIERRLAGPRSLC